MDAFLLDWANLLLRWLHVIAAIAWVGSSFYFVFLDSSLTPPQEERLRAQGATGELWAVHGGGFYHPVKYAVAPPRLPERLHWFYWESYTTWLSGFALFAVSYLWHASVWLVDPARMDWSPSMAGAAACGFLVAFWLAYDGACRLLGARRHGDALVAGVTLLLVALACWAALQLFPGRAAFLIVGAMLATAMSANVLVWIIPGQRTVVAAIRAGQPVDPVHGQRGKQRSVHNTYFTLPVLLAMLSNHYPFLYQHPRADVVLFVLMLAGVLVRQFFVLRHGHKLGLQPHPWPYAAAGVALLLAVVLALRPQPQPTAANAPPAGHAPTAATDAAAVQALLATHCLACHGAQVQMKNVRLDTPEALRQHAQAVYQQVVVTRQMPLNNPAALGEADRALIARWWRQQAPGSGSDATAPARPGAVSVQ